MKKIIVSLAVALSCTMLSSCGGFGTTGAATDANAAQGNATGSMLGNVAGNLFGGQTGSNALSNIISTFASGILTNQQSIIGTWQYSRPCVQFESENLLAQAGGAIASAKVEEKLNQYYQLAGIKPGSCSFVFGSDNTVQYTIAGRTSKGTYTFDATNKTITITSALGIKVTAYVSISVNAMALTFDASKLLTLMTAASAKSQNLSTLTALAGNYKGMKLGFAFSK